MSVARVQFGQANQSSQLSLTVTLGSPTTAGNLLVAMAVVESGQSPSTVALSGSSDSWAKDAQTSAANPAVTKIDLSVWSDPNCSGGHTQVILTPSGTATLFLAVWEVSGAAVSSPLAAAGGAASSPASTLQTAFDSGAGASVPAGCFWVGALQAVGSGGRPAPSLSGSWTAEAAQQPGSLSEFLAAYQAGPASGAPEYSGTFSAPVAGAYWSALAVAYKPASSPAAPSGLLMASYI